MTPKFLFGFFKRFYLTWRRWFKFFFKRTLPFKYIFYGKSFIWIHPRSVYWSWRFLLFIWTQDKYFSLGKMPFENLFEICTMAFGIILYHFQQFSLAMALVQIHSPKPSLIFGSCLASNPASWTSPTLIFPFKSYSNKFLPSILSIGDLQRNSTFCFEFSLQTNSPR